MFSELNDKLETVTSSPIFALDSFRMPFDLMLTSAGSKLKNSERDYADMKKKIQTLSSNPANKAEVQKLTQQLSDLGGEISHLKTLKPNHVLSRNIKSIPGLNNKVGESTMKVLNGVSKPINKIVTKMPGIAKPYKVYASGMDALGIASLVSPLAEMGYNAVKGAKKAPKAASHPSILTRASESDKAYMYNTCRKYPEEFCLSSKDSYRLLADRIFNQDSFIYEDKGFINGGFRPIPEMEDAGTPYYIRIVYTEPEFQGKGVAKKMLSSIISSTPSKDGYWIMINADNIGMHKCAESLGFSKIHELTQEDKHITNILYLKG